MSALGSLVVSLNANIAKFEQAMNRATHVATQSARGIQSSLDAIPRSIAKLAGATGGIYALTSAFQKGIKATDDYRTSIIGIAAGLTNLAKSGQGDWGDIFQRNAAYAKQMFTELERVAASSPAEPAHMQAAYNQLVQQGYAARLDEADAMGILVTRIILATGEQDKNRQINQEIRALMQGQAVAGSLIALELKDRLGPAWADIVNKHKEAGDLMKFLSSLWPGIEVAAKAYEDTLEAQQTTLIGHLKYLGREGLGGAYDDIVDYMRRINSYLVEHGELLSGQIRQGWENIKPVISAIADAVKSVTLAVIGLGANLDKVAQNPLLMATLGAALGNVKGGPMGAVAGAGAGLVLSTVAGDRAAQQRVFEGYETPGEGLRSSYIPKGAPPPAIKGPNPKAVGGGGGKGGGGKDTTEQLEDYIRQLREEVGKAAGEGFSAVNAWYDKAQAKVAKLATTTEQFERAMGVANEARVAKNQKVLDDFNKWYLDQTYQQTAVEKLELDKRLASVKGHATEEAKVREVMVLKNQERQVELAMEVGSHTKKYIDSLAGLTSDLETQNALKQKALFIEQELAKLELDRWIKQKEIPAAIADEIRGLAALEAQAKKTDLARRGEEERGTLTGWASARNRNAQGKGMSGLMDGAENFIQSAMSSGIQGVLTKDANKLKQVGATMVAGFIGELHKKSVTKIFDSLGKMLVPDEKAAGGAKSGGDVKNAAAGLNQAAVGLKSAGIGFNLNSAQFGAAAGGLLLSGIGIATNSQALVVAGTVLQVAALAIQTYQMLTATTTTAQFTAVAVSLTGSAFSLGTAAGALTSAAGALASAAGASGGGGIFKGIMGAVSSFLPFHSGGLIKAHSGYLATDERLIVAQTGERILSRQETREYDSGRSSGRGTVNHNTIHVTLPNQSQAEIDRFARRLSASLRRQESRRIA